MKIKKSSLETIIYYIMCILTLGLVCAIRITITVAIRMAFKEEN